MLPAEYESGKRRPYFLKHKYDLHNSPQVESAALRTKRRTGRWVHQDPSARIQNYLDRFSSIVEREKPEERKWGIGAVKKVLLDKFVTNFEDLPETFWGLSDRILRERGQEADYTEEEKLERQLQDAKGQLRDQKTSLEQWIDYLASPDSSYMPDYLKYWVFRSVTDMKKYDKEKKLFPQRSKGTYNKAVENFMGYVNNIYRLGGISKDSLNKFLKCLSPFAPFITEEMWARAGNEYSIHRSSWPEVKAVVPEEVVDLRNIPVTINGKLRGTILLPEGLDTEEQILAFIRNDPRFADRLEASTIKKTVYKPGKIFNIVT